MATSPDFSASNASMTDINSAPARRLATPATTQRSRKPSRGVALALVSISLVLGGIIGAALMRQRYKAQQVVLAVNGAIITKDELFRRMEQALGHRIAQQMVNEELYIQFARAKGVAPTEAQVEAAYQKLLSQPNFD